MIKHALCCLAVLTTAAPAADVLVVKSQNSEPYNQAIAGFRGACGDDKITEVNLNGSNSRTREFTERLAEEKPRIILAVGLLAAQVAKAESTTVPIVFLMVSNPGRHGLQGGNIAGVALDISVTNQFARYSALIPTMKTLGVIYDPTKTGALVEEAKTAATNAGLDLVAVPVDSQRKVRDALKTLLEKKIDALWMVPDETAITPDSFKYLARETSRNKVAFLAASEIFVEVGALAALTPDYKDMGRQSCLLAKAIESGSQKPAEIGTAPPALVNLILNLKTAEKIGLTVPQSVKDSASKRYE